MRTPPRGRGFTLVEMMVATGVSTIIALALATLVIGVRRLTLVTFGVAKASVDLRAERDRLQFHSLSEGGNARWAGLLSAGKIESVNSGGVRYTASGVDAESAVSMTRSGQTYDLDHPYRGRVDAVEAEELNGTRLFAVTLTRKYPDDESGTSAAGLEMTMADRVVVPAFGVEQASPSSVERFLGKHWGKEGE